MADAPPLFVRACGGQRGERAPVWIMRQAGRYLPEYRKLRERVDFLTATKTPEVAARITLQPMERFELDAAILFADIMTPLEGMGVPMHFDPGPVIEDPVRSVRQAEALRPLDPEADTSFVLDALRIVRAELDAARALIAFAGAPFTLLCYLVEGGGSKDFMEARRFVRSEPEASTRLLELLGRSMAGYLVAQARAGADALMLFDSWIGLLDEDAYRRLVVPVLNDVIAAVRREVAAPILYFPRGGGHLLGAVRELGADVIGIDWTMPLSEAAGRIGPDAVVQGNLDPSALFASEAELGRAIDRVVEEGASARAHVFNLGHGIDRATDPGRVAFLVDRVRETSLRTYGALASARAG